MRVVDAEGYHEPRDGISHEWVRLLEAEGWEPLLVPNVLTDPIAFVEHGHVGVVLLTNGEDVHPSRYMTGEVPTGFKCSPERDETELALLGWAMDHRVPVLAVCRGLHLVNTYFGGSIVPDIWRSVPGALDHVATVHNVDIVDPATRKFVGKAKAALNSYHKHGVSEETLAAGLTPFARTADGIVEGFYTPDAPLLAVQWHPERPGPEDYCQRSMVVRFLEDGPWW